jgi:hypothetical protein
MDVPRAVGAALQRRQNAIATSANALQTIAIIGIVRSGALPGGTARDGGPWGAAR